MQSTSYYAGPGTNPSAAPMYSQVPPTHPQSHPQQDPHLIKILQSLNKLSNRLKTIEMQQATDVMNVGDMVEQMRKDIAAIKHDFAQQLEDRNNNDATTKNTCDLLGKEVLAASLTRQDSDQNDELAKLKKFVDLLGDQWKNQHETTLKSCGLLGEQLLAIRGQTEHFMMEVAKSKDLVRAHEERLQQMSYWSTQTQDAAMTKLNLDKKVRVQPLRRNPLRCPVLEAPLLKPNLPKVAKMGNKRKPSRKVNKGRRR